MAKLDFVVLHEQPDHSFRSVDIVPDWFLDLCPDSTSGLVTNLEERFPFLENFLIDAWHFWGQAPGGCLESGPWTELDSSGSEVALEARAIIHEQARLLLIQRLTGQFSESREILQRAREGSLEIERLDRLRHALRMSANQARSLLKSVPDLMFRVTREGSYLDFRESDSVPGRKAVSARNLHDVLPGNDVQEFMNQVHHVLEVGKTRIFEYQSGDDGKLRDFEARIAACGENEVLVIVRDITERKRAEIELAERLEQVKSSRDDLLLILNQLRLGTALTDERGQCIFLSQTAQQMFGIREQEVLGKTWEESGLFDREHLMRLKIMSERPQASRSRVPVHWERNDGRQYWMEVDLQDDPSSPKRKIFFFYDVSEVHDLRRLLDEKAQFETLVGKSKPMQQVYRLIQDLASVDATVLIEGATGTGKELVARAIYSRSHRRNRPFVAVNCAGLTESLVASQLFGHRRGAFTGAVADSQGLFEAANGGVLFLDEIGDVPLSVQTSLLRVLQEREITRLGETKPRKVDVRVLSATHRNLGREVDRGNFRADLLYRIRVARIQIPPLAERLEDIPLLVSRFLGEFRASTGKLVQEVSTRTLGRLMEYQWPGNVRELRSAIEFAVIRCRGPVIRPEDLPPELKDAPLISGASPKTLVSTLLDEKERILAALNRAGGNRTNAARILGISRATLYRRIDSLQLKTR